jgi:molecular chaperone GrpE
MRQRPIQVRPVRGPNDASPPEDADQTEARPEAAPPEGESELEMWRDRALRLQAEMENYRKRQRRLADEQIAAGREQVLRALVEAADNLSRALDAARSPAGVDATSLREGVQATLQGVQQALEREDVRPIEAKRQPFDPQWHEAVSTVPSQAAGVAPQTVVEELQRGYMLGERVLRPARVIVAV